MAEKIVIRRYMHPNRQSGLLRRKQRNFGLIQVGHRLNNKSFHAACGELETAARWKIPAVIVVNNNRSLNQEINVYSRAYGGSLHGRHGELWHFRDTDFAAVAESMGVLGLTVTKASDFESALEKALASKGPALINVVTEIEAMAPRSTTERAAAAH